MRALLFVAIGLSVGTVSGALGIGGGILLMPALIWLCGFEPYKAAGTSLAVLALPVTLPAALKYYSARRMDLEAAVWIALAFVVGAYVGASLVYYIPQQMLRLVFGLIMIYIAVRFILASDSQVAEAAAGLTSFALAIIAFFGLRALGRKHLVRPDLGTHIRDQQEKGWEDSEYYI